MNDLYTTPGFPQRPGLTEEEKKKVDAYIKKNRVTKCPGMGSFKLTALNIAKYMKWLNNVGIPQKTKLGYVPLKNSHEDVTPRKKNERRKAYFRKYYQRKKRTK